MIQIKGIEPVQKPNNIPSEDALRKLLAIGEVETVLTLIDTHKLKYRIERDKSDGTYKLLGALEGTELWLKKFITQDEDMIALKNDVRKLAKTNDEVLITGETGTGKELIARALIGDRETAEQRGKFVAVNCAGLPEQLIESELFGHAKGSFTGAVSDKTGLMQAAKNGVLFLDEVAELPMSVQGKLLRALQDRRIRKVGSNTEEEINCKFVCATHKDIRRMVKEDKFRIDLYARISTFELHISSLKERRGDIIPILESLPNGANFIKRDNGKLIDLDVTLNVRSLQKAVKRFTVLGRV